MATIGNTPVFGAIAGGAQNDIHLRKTGEQQQQQNYLRRRSDIENNAYMSREEKLQAQNKNDQENQGILSFNKDGQAYLGEAGTIPVIDQNAYAKMQISSKLNDMAGGLDADGKTSRERELEGALGQYAYGTPEWKKANDELVAEQDKNSKDNFLTTARAQKQFQIASSKLGNEAKTLWDDWQNSRQVVKTTNPDGTITEKVVFDPTKEAAYKAKSKEIDDHQASWDNNMRSVIDWAVNNPEAIGGKTALSASHNVLRGSYSPNTSPSQMPGIKYTSGNVPPPIVPDQSRVSMDVPDGLKNFNMNDFETPPREKFPAPITMKSMRTPPANILKNRQANYIPELTEWNTGRMNSGVGKGARSWFQANPTIVRPAWQPPALKEDDYKVTSGGITRNKYAKPLPDLNEWIDNFSNSGNPLFRGGKR